MLSVQTYASELYARDPISNYVTAEAHSGYLENNPHNEFRSFDPIGDEGWKDPTDDELVMHGAPQALLLSLIHI